MPESIVLAGISCSEVLACLSDYIDGELDEARTASLEAHLAQCSHCAQFGEQFVGALARLRTTDEPDLDPGVAQRLAQRLAETDT